MSDRNDPAQVERYAERILSSQDVRFGSVAMNSRRGDGLLEPVPPLQVAAVLHTLADYTLNTHMLTVAHQHLMARPDDGDFDREGTSLGRFFHALADQIERQEIADPAICEPGGRDPRTSSLYQFLEDYDKDRGDGFFDWRAGGEGDNGEALMDALDAFFARGASGEEDLPDVAEP